MTTEALREAAELGALAVKEETRRAIAAGEQQRAQMQRARLEPVAQFLGVSVDALIRKEAKDHVEYHIVDGEVWRTLPGNDWEQLTGLDPHMEAPRAYWDAGREAEWVPPTLDDIRAAIQRESV